jgi:Niemann-Pick C1 protein
MQTNTTSAQVEDHIAPKAEKLGLSVSWSSESSVQRELARESFLDTSTVALSYLAMLIYIGIALGKYSSRPQRNACKERIVKSRCLLGLSGVAVVLCSVLGGLGICSALGVSASLIVMEVVPFLVLAIGVDNMFLIAAEEEVQDTDLPVEERVANALASVGPSITMSTGCEVLAFLAAALTRVPAVRNFALVAAAAVALDFLLQITAFVAFLTLDCQRMQTGYADVIPCVQLITQPSDASLPDWEVEEVSGDEDPGSPVALDQDYQHKAADDPRSGVQALISWMLERLHSSVLSSPHGKFAILVLGLLFNAAAIISVSQISIGLDQQVALPKDSYLQRYYRCGLKQQQSKCGAWLHEQGLLT